MRRKRIRLLLRDCHLRRLSTLSRPVGSTSCYSTRACIQAAIILSGERHFAKGKCSFREPKIPRWSYRGRDFLEKPTANIRVTGYARASAYERNVTFHRIFIFVWPITHKRKERELETVGPIEMSGLDTQPSRNLVAIVSWWTIQRVVSRCEKLFRRCNPWYNRESEQRAILLVSWFSVASACYYPGRKWSVLGERSSTWSLYIINNHRERAIEKRLKECKHRVRKSAATPSFFSPPLKSPPLEDERERKAEDVEEEEASGSECATDDASTARLVKQFSSIRCRVSSQFSSKRANRTRTRPVIALCLQKNQVLIRRHPYVDFAVDRIVAMWATWVAGNNVAQVVNHPRCDEGCVTRPFQAKYVSLFVSRFFPQVRDSWVVLLFVSDGYLSPRFFESNTFCWKFPCDLSVASRFDFEV